MTTLPSMRPVAGRVCARPLDGHAAVAARSVSAASAGATRTTMGGRRLLVVASGPQRPLVVVDVIVFIVEIHELVVEVVEVIIVLVLIIVLVVVFVLILVVEVDVVVVEVFVLVVEIVRVVEGFVVEIVIIAPLCENGKRQIRRLEHGRHCSVLLAGRNGEVMRGSVVK